jgi:hypothetical protein
MQKRIYTCTFVKDEDFLPGGFLRKGAELTHEIARKTLPIDTRRPGNPQAQLS